MRVRYTTESPITTVTGNSVTMDISTFTLAVCVSLMIALSHPVTSYVIGDIGQSKTIRLTQDQRQCVESQACGIAVCPWHQDIFFPDRESCMFMRTTCLCPATTHCSTTQTPTPSTPESGVIIFNYQCVSR